MDYFDEKDIAKLIKAQDKEIEVYVQSLVKEIDSLLSQVTRQIKPDAKLSELLSILNQLSTQNLPEKIKIKLRDAVGLYQSRVKTVGEMIQQASTVSTVFNDNDDALVKAIFENDIAIQLTTINQTFGEFKQAVFRGVYTNGLPQLPELQASLGERLSGVLNTQTNTQLAGFQRSIHIQKADELELQYFLYAGSLIKSSRPFCIQRSGRIYTTKEAMTWDNKQGLPTIPYLGGYNCRHTMVFMSQEKAISMGYRSGI